MKLSVELEAKLRNAVLYLQYAPSCERPCGDQRCRDIGCVREMLRADIRALTTSAIAPQ